MDHSSDSLEPVEELVEEFLQRRRQGETPTIEEYLERYPDLAEQIREVFPALAIMEQAAPQSVDLTSPSGSVNAQESVPLKQVGDYRILREIGRGGMGVVYEAEQESLCRRVALKVLPQQIAGDARSLERFQREARAAARMHHTNIVPVFEVGQDDEIVFYAMQLIRGQALDSVIDELKQLRRESTRRSREGTENSRSSAPGEAREISIAAAVMSGQFASQDLVAEADAPGLKADQAPVVASPLEAPQNNEALAETVRHHAGSTSSAVLPGQSEIASAETHHQRFYRSVAQIGLQTAQALSYSHARGIIHRDIKPSNLLLDAAGVVWITDFGLAKTGGEGMTHTGDLLGTLRYMSAERFRGQCDVRADVYSLGLTLYELLVLRPAFQSPDRLALIEMITQSEPSTLRSIDPRVPRDLETIVLKSIDKDLKRRYQSADDLAEDLRRFIDDEPILARRISVAERAIRWSRKNKALATALSVVVSLILVVVLGTTLAAGYFKHQEGIQRELVNEKTILADKSEQLARQKAQALAAQLEAGRKLQESLSQVEAARNLAQQKETEAEQRRKESDELRIQAERAQQLATQEAERNRRLLYVSNMHLASQLWESEHGTSSAVESLLASWIPPENEEDLRDFAWRLLWQQFRYGAARSVLETGTPQVAISHDGLLLTLDERMQISHWARDRQVPQRTLSLQPEDPTIVRLLSPDGKTLAVSTKAGTVELFDTDTGKSVQKLDVAGNVQMAFSPDGRFLGTLPTRLRADQEDPSVQVWEVAEGKLHHGIRIHPISFRPNLILSPDGTRVLVSGQPHHSAVTVYGMDEIVERSHLSTVTSLGWSPVDDIAASGDSNGKVSLWDTETWQNLAILHAHAHHVTGIAFSPDGTRLAIASQNGSLSIWDTQSFQRQAVLKGHTTPVVSLAFSPDGQELASGSKDGVAKLWDLELQHGPRIIHNLPTLSYAISKQEQGFEIQTPLVSKLVESGTLAAGEMIVAIARGEDGAFVNAAELSLEQAMRILTRDAGTLIRLQIISRNDDPQAQAREARLVRRLDVPQASLSRVACSRNGKWLAAVGVFGTSLRDLSSGELVACLPYRGDAIAFSPDNSWIAVNHRNTVKFWDFRERRELGTWDLGSSVGSLAFSPDGAFLAAGPGKPFISMGERETDVRIWDVAGARELPPLKGHQGWIPSVAFSPDGKQLASASQDATVKLWNVADWSEVRTLRTPIPYRDLQSLTFSPDGESVVAGDDSGRILIWETATGNWVRTLDGHGFVVQDLEFSPDGRVLGSASWDRTIKLWNWADYQEIHVLRGHTDWVNALAFSPDGNTLISCSTDGTMRLWEATPSEDIDKDAMLLNAMFKLARKYHRQRDGAKARALFRKTLALQEHVLGPTHLRTLETLSNLGGSYYNERNYDKAAELWTDGLHRSWRELGAEDRITQLFLANLQLADKLQINALQKAGDQESVLALYQRGLETFKTILGNEHAVTAHYRSKLSDESENLRQQEDASGAEGSSSDTLE